MARECGGLCPDAVRRHNTPKIFTEPFECEHETQSKKHRAAPARCSASRISSVLYTLYPQMLFPPLGVSCSVNILGAIARGLCPCPRIFSLFKHFLLFYFPLPSPRTRYTHIFLCSVHDDERRRICRSIWHSIWSLRLFRTIQFSSTVLIT